MVNCSSAQSDTALHNLLVKYIICLVSNTKQTQKNSIKKKKNMVRVNIYILCIYYNAYVLILTEKGQKPFANNMH